LCRDGRGEADSDRGEAAEQESAHSGSGVGLKHCVSTLLIDLGEGPEDQDLCVNEPESL